MRQIIHYILFIALGFYSLIASDLYARQSPASEEKYVFQQKQRPEKIDNYRFSLYYKSGNRIFNLGGMEMASCGSSVENLKVNPSGASFAIVGTDAMGRKILSVFDLWKTDKSIFQLRNIPDISDIEFTPDADYLAVATSGKVSFYDSGSFTPGFEIPVENSKIIERMVFSPSGDSMALAQGKQVDIYDVKTKTRRKSLPLQKQINDMSFSNAGDSFAVLTNDGTLHIYDTLNFSEMESVGGFGKALALSFDPDDNYVSVVTGDSRIEVFNLLDYSDRKFVEDKTGGISDARFVRNNKGNVYLAYNTVGNITYQPISSLSPCQAKSIEVALKDSIDKSEEILTVVTTTPAGSNVQEQRGLPDSAADRLLLDFNEYIISLAREKEKQTGHTHYDADLVIFTEKDWHGEKIMNCKLNFEYGVDHGFSSAVDYAPGKYKVEDSQAVASMLDIVKTALETYYSDYVKPGKRLLVKITGFADTAPLKSRVGYDGVYGNFYNAPIFKKGDPTVLTVNQASGILDNNQLAFLRAMGIKDFISKKIDNIDKMDVDYVTCIEPSHGKKGAVKLELTFMDAFER